MRAVQPILAFLVLSTGFGAKAPSQDVEPSIAGTWKLVRFMNVVDGERTYPFGENPVGYFVYTADGHVMIQIQHESPPDKWRSLDTTAGGFGVDAPWYVGYFGTYSVRASEGVVIHHVEGGTVLRYIGTDQPRPFRLQGDRLLIGEEGAWERELVRVGTSSDSRR